MTAIAELRQKRLHDCRLTSDRKLETLDEAEAFLIDRGVLTLTQDSALPSLRGTTDPYPAGSHVEATLVALSRERVRRGRLGLDQLERSSDEVGIFVKSRPGARGLAVPFPYLSVSSRSVAERDRIRAGITGEGKGCGTRSRVANSY